KVLNLWEPSTGVRQIDCRTGKVRELWPADEKQKRAAVACLTPDGRTLLAWSSESGPQGWCGWLGSGDISTQKWRKRIELGACEATNYPLAAFSPDGRFFAEGNGPERLLIRWWATHTGKARERGPVVEHFPIFSALAFSADGKMLAAGTKDGTIY